MRKMRKVTFFNDMATILTLLVLYVAYQKVGIIRSIDICIKIILVDFILKSLFAFFSFFLHIFGQSKKVKNNLDSYATTLLVLIYGVSLLSIVVFFTFSLISDINEL
jgi:hypothetical protein